MRRLVYVHGSCKHVAGYSNPWFAAMRPYTEVYGDGILGDTRIEVLWDSVVPGGLVNSGSWADCLSDFMYWIHDEAVRSAITERFVDTVMPYVEAGDQLDIIAHSEGSMVAYEGLCNLDITAESSVILNLLTPGSALSLPKVRNLIDPPAPASAPKPLCVRNWVN